MEEVKLSEKLLLNVNEASEYSGIGHSKMREILNTPNCPFLIMNGIKKLVKRKQFEEWLETQENL
jgi:hypothetical protein